MNMEKASSRLKELRIVGGFLDGFKYSFTDKLNCIIGARGTGKTTVLEFIRYGLNAMPLNPKAHKRIAALVEGNLRGGRIELTIETAEGITYVVSRNVGEDPMVLDAEMNPTGMPFTPNIFRLDVFSQNEVEEIAEQGTYQMALLESFSKGELTELNSQIHQTRKALEANSVAILPLKEREKELVDALNLLPGLQKRLAEFATGGSEDAEILNKAHEQKSIRTLECQFSENLIEVYKGVAGKIRKLTDDISEQLRWRDMSDLQGGENIDLIRSMYDEVASNNAIVNAGVQALVDELTASYRRFDALKQQLLRLHQQQELNYRHIVEKGKEEQERSAERRKVADEHTKLIASQCELGEIRRKISALQQTHSNLQQELSNLCDRRFQIRHTIATRINQALSPYIRVTLNQCGSIELYYNLLADALKGTPMQYRQVANTIAELIAPAKLTAILKNDDMKRLICEAGINQNQAKLVMTTLQNPAFISKLEIVDLPDTSKIELNDHGSYKATETLSTGQKCNAILPILLLDSDRPLLIDQPEDNLDNEFVHNIIVESVLRVKQNRQLVFVTHNPNIPVLGEAERILVMESDGTAGHIRNTGSVDDCKANIVSILEGGEEAFKKRKDRYDY